jgi:hypothetical protein
MQKTGRPQFGDGLVRGRGRSPHAAPAGTLRALPKCLTIRLTRPQKIGLREKAVFGMLEV